MVRDGSRYVAHVLPLTSGARRLTGIAYSATAALFISKVTTEAPSAPEAIARAYHLTPTELRVLLAIVGVAGSPKARCPRHCRKHGQDAPRQAVCEDRRPSPGRPCENRRGISSPLIG